MYIPSLASKVSLAVILNALVAIEAHDVPDGDDQTYIAAEDMHLCLMEIYAKLPHAEHLSDIMLNVFLGIYDK